MIKQILVSTLLLFSLNIFASIECEMYGNRFIKFAGQLNSKINAGMEFHDVILALEEEDNSCWLAIPKCDDSPASSPERITFCSQVPALLSLRVELIHQHVVVHTPDELVQLLFRNQGMQNYVALVCP